MFGVGSLEVSEAEGTTPWHVCLTMASITRWSQCLCHLPLLLEACKSHAPSLNHYFHFANLLADDGTIFVYVPLFWK